MDTVRINRVIFSLIIFLQVSISAQNNTVNSEAMLESMRSIQYSNPSSALKLGLNILDVETHQPMSQISAKTKNTLGEILQDQGLPNQALEYYVDALNEYFILEDSIAIGWIYVNIGNVYFHQNLFENATEKYQQAVDVFKEIDLRTGEATALNNLALIAIELFDLDSAIALFSQGLEARMAYNDPALIAHSYLYLGEVYLDKKKKQKALAYFQKALEIGMETDTLNLIGDSHQYIGLINFYMNEDSLAMINFQLAETDYITKSNKYSQMQLYIQMANLFHSRSGFKSEEKYLNKALAIAEKHGYIKHQIDILGNLVLLPNTILTNSEKIKLHIKLNLLHQSRFETEMKKTLIRSELKLILEVHKRNLIRKEAELDQAVLSKNVSIIIGILLVLLVVVLLNRYQYKKRSNVFMLKQKDEIHHQAMKIEKLNAAAIHNALKNDLNLKKRELVSNATFLQQKNDILIELKKDLEYHVDLLNDEEDKRRFKSIISSMAAANESDDHWHEFQKQFRAVYPGMLERISQLNPSLTVTDLKMCTYQKMNMSTKDIAKLTGLSVRSIQSRKYRLRKKLKIPKGESILSFLNTIDVKHINI